MRRMRAPRLISALVVLALSIALNPAASAGDPAKDIKDKDFQVRLAAIEALEATGGPEAEPLLIDALNDKDWEVVERAALALAKKGTTASVQELVNLAAEGPVRRIRMVAAKSAGKIDETKALEALGRKLHGDY